MIRLRPIAALALAALASLPAHADVIYATGFESPTFVTGGIAGQDGWSVFNGAATSTIQNTVAASGTQAVRVDGAAAGQHGPFHADATAASSLVLSADILLTSAASSGGWQFAALGPGLVGFTGGIDVFGTSIQAITAGFPVIGALALDVWSHIEIDLDFTAQTATYKLNGATLASSLAFCGDNGPCAGANVAQYGSAIFDTFGGGTDVGYMDNFSLASVPEPGTLTLLGAALFGLAVRRRRRGRSSSRSDRICASGAW